MKSTTAILASRNLAARRALGSAVNVVGQRGEKREEYGQPVASTMHGTGRYCQHAGCIAPAATLSTYNGRRFHYGCNLAALDAIGQHAGDASL
jgi:hypothetical protein